MCISFVVSKGINYFTLVKKTYNCYANNFVGFNIGIRVIETSLIFMREMVLTNYACLENSCSQDAGVAWKAISNSFGKKFIFPKMKQVHKEPVLYACWRCKSRRLRTTLF